MRGRKVRLILQVIRVSFQDILLVQASYDLLAIHHLLANMSDDLQIEKIVLKVGQQ